jgi:hypothetical protein
MVLLNQSGRAAAPRSISFHFVPFIRELSNYHHHYHFFKGAARFGFGGGRAAG